MVLVALEFVADLGNDRFDLALVEIGVAQRYGLPGEEIGVRMLVSLEHLIGSYRRTSVCSIDNLLKLKVLLAQCDLIARFDLEHAREGKRVATISVFWMEEAVLAIGEQSASNRLAAKFATRKCADQSIPRL